MKELKSKNGNTYFIYSHVEEIDKVSIRHEYAHKKPIRQEWGMEEGFFAYSTTNIEEEINKIEYSNIVLHSSALYYDAVGEEFQAKEILERFHRVWIDYEDLTIRTYCPRGLVNYVFFPKG